MVTDQENETDVIESRREPLECKLPTFVDAGFDCVLLRGFRHREVRQSSTAWSSKELVALDEEGVRGWLQDGKEAGSPNGPEMMSSR